MRRPSRLLLPERGSSRFERVIAPRIFVAWVMVHGCLGVSCLFVGVEVRKNSGFAEEGFRKCLAFELHCDKGDSLSHHGLFRKGQQLPLGGAGAGS